MGSHWIPAQGCVLRDRRYPLSPFTVPKPITQKDPATGEETVVQVWWGQVGGDYGWLPGDSAWFCAPLASGGAAGMRPVSSRGR